MILKQLIIIPILFLISGSLLGQSSPNTLNDLMSQIELNIDTSTFNYNDHHITTQNKKRLAFQYEENNSIVEFVFTPNKNKPFDTKFELVLSDQFKVIDSLQFLEGKYYRVVVEFQDLSSADFLSFTFSYGEGNKQIHLPLRLQPYVSTYAKIYPKEEDLFIGEEKRLEVVSNHPENIKVDERWKNEDGYDYRYIREDDKVFLVLLPTKLNDIDFELVLHTKNPFLDVYSELSYSLPIHEYHFSVKGTRLTFLKVDQREIIKEKGNREGVEIQIENTRLLEINKTYRVEDTDEKGGPLIAELYTVRRLSNDKVLCMFRPYSLHSLDEGYLYIKDGDEPMFITNVDILPEAKVSKISILRDGGSWTQNTNIYPGETFELRIEGEGLQKASFIFDDLVDLSSDSLLRNGNRAHYLLKVPVNIRKKSVSIYNQKKNTGFNLDVQEYQRPQHLHFVTVDFGERPKELTAFQQPALHQGTIGDIVLSFEADDIDFGEQLFGKQFLEIEIQVKSNKNELIELKTIDNVVVCPDVTSPRYSFYKASGGCMNEPISLNEYLSNKTHDLKNWEKVEVTVKHQKNKYGGDGYTERFTVIKQKVVTFDVDLSIPAGLIIKKVGVDGFPGLTGISLSMLAQFSFYKKDEIQKLRPFKIGAGFLAQNAFNFNPDAERDLGIVILGSVYPTKKERKFTFPLYAGFGYFLNEEKFFYLIGPGVRINL